MSPSVEVAHLLRRLYVLVELPKSLLGEATCHFVTAILPVQGTHQIFLWCPSKRATVSRPCSCEGVRLGLFGLLAALPHPLRWECIYFPSCPPSGLKFGVLAGVIFQ